MKASLKILFMSAFCLCLLLLAACGQSNESGSTQGNYNNQDQAAPQNELYTKEQLLSVLEQVYNSDAFIVGQQGEQTGQLPSYSLNIFTKVTGQLPGILGLDLGCYGMYIQNYDKDKWDKAISEIVDFCRSGGIIEISSHLDNPADPSQQVRGTLGSFSTEAELENAFYELVTEGTELNKAFKKSITRDGEFLQDLRDNGVTVLWRPFHEMNGDWFWYCVSSNGITVSPECWTSLWRYVYDYYTNDMGLDNLIWIYAPNKSDNYRDSKGSLMSTLYCFPGKEYCDIVGVDWYPKEASSYIPSGYKNLIDDSQYIGALTEFGPSGDILADRDMGEKQTELFNCLDANELLLKFRDRKNKFAYVLSWNGKWSFTTLGKSKEFMELEHTLGASELKEMFDTAVTGR